MERNHDLQTLVKFCFITGEDSGEALWIILPTEEEPSVRSNIINRSIIFWINKWLPKSGTDKKL